MSTNSYLDIHHSRQRHKKLEEIKDQDFTQSPEALYQDHQEKLLAEVSQDSIVLNYHNKSNKGRKSNSPKKSKIPTPKFRSKNSPKMPPVPAVTPTKDLKMNSSVRHESFQQNSPFADMSNMEISMLTNVTKSAQVLPNSPKSPKNLNNGNNEKGDFQAPQSPKTTPKRSRIPHQRQVQISPRILNAGNGSPRSYPKSPLVIATEALKKASIDNAKIKRLESEIKSLETDKQTLHKIQQAHEKQKKAYLEDLRKLQEENEKLMNQSVLDRDITSALQEELDRARHSSASFQGASTSVSAEGQRKVSLRKFLIGFQSLTIIALAVYLIFEIRKNEQLNLAEKERIEAESRSIFARSVEKTSIQVGQEAMNKFFSEVAEWMVRMRGDE